MIAKRPGQSQPQVGFTLIPDFSRYAIRESGMRESVCPVNVRSQSGQPCALCRTGDFSVLATARHTRVCLRVAVLHKSPRPASVCSAAATAFVTLVVFGAVARNTARARSSSSSLPFVVGLLPRLPLAIRVAMLRRRDTAFSPRLRLAALSANRSPPSRSAPPRHPSRTSPRWRCVSFVLFSAPPWFCGLPVTAAPLV